MITIKNGRPFIYTILNDAEKPMEAAEARMKSKRESLQHPGVYQLHVLHGDSLFYKRII